MNLLGTEAYRNSLAAAITNAKQSIVVVSAFVTKGGCEWINHHISHPSVAVQFIVRWKLQDLISGASDLDSYEYARSLGWDFYVQPDLHAKVALVDDHQIYLGSANVTNKGLALAPGGNREFGVSFLASQRDLDVIKTVQDESVYITPELYLEIRKYLDELPPDEKTKASDGEWPNELKEKFLQPPQKLWVADLLWSSPSSESLVMEISPDFAREIEHDTKLLGLPVLYHHIEASSLLPAFISSRAYHWLICQLKKNGGQLHYGELTVRLHDALLDDPLPYRKDIKCLVSNLLSWVEFLKVPGLAVDIPGRHSQRLRVLSE
ncbi:PLD-like domain-containing protein [Mariprofundus ferrinatatus]|uniref:PLD-like domain-containing protein n=1 Tax=Mariprofundus ferrinatatus TaxID=1921087 RepID=A0A2K8L7A3_9PROT|nr:phospholipase D family protein [Mariprofundus ferrinatatus]ATX81731.1 PLD-like domain-containing protein [Mariprofundus ferrinatatus]